MAAEPTICFRCTADFRNRFIGAAKTRGTSAQAVLERFAAGWLEDPDRALSAARASEPPARSPAEHVWHQMLDHILGADEDSRRAIQRTLEWGVTALKGKIKR